MRIGTKRMLLKLATAVARRLYSGRRFPPQRRDGGHDCLCDRQRCRARASQHQFRAHRHPFGRRSRPR